MSGIKINIDLKVIVIIILSGLLIFKLIFHKDKNINKYEKEIEELKNKNDKLKSYNDSLTNVNLKLIKDIDSLYYSIDSTMVEIKIKEVEIKKLEHEKIKVGAFVNKLNSNGVSSELSRYLNKKNR